MQYSAFCPAFAFQSKKCEFVDVLVTAGSPPALAANVALLVAGTTSAISDTTSTEANETGAVRRRKPDTANPLVVAIATRVHPVFRVASLEAWLKRGSRSSPEPTAALAWRYAGSSP